MRIVNFGSCNIDYVYRLHHIVLTGETEHSDVRDVFAGGKGLNQSIALARSGAEVFHAGCIGSDGSFLLQTLNESGVDTSFVRTVPGPSGHAVIQVSDSGENAIFIHSGANDMFTDEYIDEVLGHFDRGDIVVLQNEINSNAYIIDRAYEKGMICILNPSPIDRKISYINFDKLSYIVINEIEGERLTGEREPLKIISAMRAAHPNLSVILTLGDKGCIFADGEALYSHPAFETNVVDTTAAGDTFTGYFISGLRKVQDPMKLLERACAASAVSVSRKGAAPSIPNDGEVTEALKTLRLKQIGGESAEKHLQSKIDEYLKTNLACASLSEIASSLGYSNAYTGHLMKKLIGKSFSAYLQEARCAAASKMLLETDMPVSAIIHEVGYNNESFFRGKFKELYGSTPLNYKKTMSGKIKKENE